MKRSLRSILRIFLSGLLALVPFVVTIGLIIWLGGVIQRVIGPGSFTGGILSRLGLTLVTDPIAAYALGAVVLVLGVYLLGLIVESRLKQQFRTLSGLLEGTVRRLPLIGSIYDLTDRFVKVFGKPHETGLKAMSPVWCFFGGAGGTAVLGLMPNPEPVVLAGKVYRAVLIPTAPVPIGGGLLYVPEEWIQPAEIGVEAFTSTYVSMGVSAPVPATPPPPNP